MPDQTFKRWTADDIAKLNSLLKNSGRKTLQPNLVDLCPLPL
jgi:hypothetical protein